MTYATAGCPDSAPQWRIEYRLHFSDGAGRTVSRDLQASMLAEADRFAQETGRLSECAVRLRLDVVEDAGPYTGTASGYEVGKEQVPAGYDALLVAYPAPDGRGGGGITDFKAAWFPVTDRAPNRYLLMHEWLHMVVGFYRTPIGWPHDDVHGACERPDYAERARDADGGTWGCMVNPGWFSDLMTGRVPENGQLRGLPRDQWAWQGTPTDRRNTPTDPADVSVWADVERRRLTLAGPAGPAELVITAADGRERVRRAVELPDAKPLKLKLPDLGFGSFSACLVIPGRGGWPGLESCDSYAVVPDTAALLTVKRAGGRVLVSARGALAGQRARLRFVAGACTFSCIRERKSAPRTVTLRSRPRALSAPARPASARNGGYVRLTVTVKRFEVDGVRYPGFRRKFSAR